MMTIITSIIFLAVLIYIFFFKKSDVRKHYEDLLTRTSLTVEEQLWVYCYKHSYEIVKRGDYYLIKNCEGKIYDRGDDNFYTHVYSKSRMYSLEECLEVLNKRFPSASYSNVILDGNKIPQSKDVFLDDLIKHELDPQEKELLIRIKERLGK